jgi:hypothetical protein
MRYRRPPLVPALFAQKTTVSSVIERSVSAGSKVLVFTVDLATPGRRYSEVHDGMEKDPTLLGMLGFVAQGAIQPYSPTGGLPTVDSSAAIGRPSLALHLHEFIHRHHIVIEMSHDHHRAKNDQTGHEHPKCQREKVIRLIGRT